MTISSHSVNTDCSKRLFSGVMSHDQNIVNMHDIVYKSGKHNFKKSRIPLNTNWNITYLRNTLVDYDDKDIM